MIGLFFAHFPFPVLATSGHDANTRVKCKYEITLLLELLSSLSSTSELEDI